MPKGDRDILKADIEDGYAPVAHLILEALAISTMSGVQKGICCFVLRRTYSWGRKDDEISLNDFSRGCNSKKSYISEQLNKLLKSNVLIRTAYNPGKTCSYMLNPKINEWRDGLVDLQKLQQNMLENIYKSRTLPQKKNPSVKVEPSRKNGTEPFRKSRTVPFRKSGTPRAKNPNNGAGCGPPKYIIKYILNKDNNNARESLVKIYEKELGRLLTPLNYENIKDMETEFGYDLVLEAIRMAAAQGKWTTDYINTILINWSKNSIRTPEDVALHEQQRQRGKTGAFNQRSNKTTGHDERAIPRGILSQFCT